MKDEKHKILFALEGDALIVANTGAPFSRTGIISVCNMDLSSKDAVESRAPVDEYGEADNALVGAISKKCLDVYSGTINRLTEDANSEARIEQSYDGRFMWELLQNADDAADAARANAHLIGAKGLGFKSVLGITKEPEIYSGEFDFHFSERKSREKLREEVPEWEEEYGVPVCRLPHAKEADEEVQNLVDNGYVTVIRLPLNAEKREDVKRELDEFCASALLFCQRLEFVEIRSGEDVRRIHVRRADDGQTIELRDNGNCESWRVWRAQRDVGGEKQLSVSVCLPVIDQEVWHCEEVPFLNVFFPTAEQIANVYALVHVSCEVESNRRHLASRQKHEAEICEMLGSMTEKILLEIPANAAIGAFGMAPSENAGGNMVARLGESVSKSVRETAFIPVIGGGRVTPNDVLLWEYGLGDAVAPGKVRGKNLCAMEIQDNEGSVCILHELGAEDMTVPEHADLLRFCKNSTKNDCLHTWGVAQSLMQNANRSTKEECADALRKVPFWWTRNGRARAIEGNIPLAEKKPENFPDWLPVHIVDHGFLRLVKKEKWRREKNEGWKDALSGEVAPVRKREYFDHILLPYCKKQSSGEWKTHGWEILALALKWGGAGDAGEPLIIGSGDDKEMRAKIIHLPAGKNADKWVPAWQCYASAAWGAPKMFDYFADIEDRFVLAPPKSWSIDVSADKKEQWKILLSWLGCAWTPTMFQQRKLRDEQDLMSTRTEEELDFDFEHFFEMLPHAQPSDHAALLIMGHAMYGFAKSRRAKCFYYWKRHADSWALQQLQKAAWVPCKRSLLYPADWLFMPSTAYLPECSLGGLFPEVDVRGLEKSQDAGAIEKTLVNLGVNAGIPDDPDALIGYMNQLSKSAERNGMNLWWKKGKDAKEAGIARAAKAIFNAYEKIDSPPELGESVMVPCLRQVHEGEVICFKKAEEVCWADEPYFDELEVRREILKNQALHVFFLFLDKGKKFGLKPLSEYLEMQLEDGKNRKNLPEEEERMRTKYKERRFGLAQATGTKLPEQLRVIAYDNITLRSNVFPDISAEIKFWEEKGCVLINAGRNKNMWQSLAAALGKVGKCPEHKSDFEILLSAGKWEYFVARLRDDYGLSEDSMDEVQEYAPAEPDPDVISQPKSGPDYGATEPASAIISSPISSSPVSPAPAPRRDVVRARSAASPPIPKLTVVHDYVWPPKAPATHGGGQHGGGQHGGEQHGGEQVAREDAGGEGEYLLAQHLSDEFGGANVKNMNEQIRNHPGYDILVEVNGEKFYYECKSFAAKVPPRSVPLTKAQFKKAEEEGERYRLCVIFDRAGDPKMLPPFCAPATLKNEPSRYRVYLPGSDRGPQPDEASS
ncbi:MAG: DUF3883 domain-containing protein [Gammaproteobacteria bacterium]